MKRFVPGDSAPVILHPPGPGSTRLNSGTNFGQKRSRQIWLNSSPILRYGHVPQKTPSRRLKMAKSPAHTAQLRGSRGWGPGQKMLKNMFFFVFLDYLGSFRKKNFFSPGTPKMAKLPLPRAQPDGPARAKSDPKRSISPNWWRVGGREAYG